VAGAAERDKKNLEEGAVVGDVFFGKRTFEPVDGGRDEGEEFRDIIGKVGAVGQPLKERQGKIDSRV